VIFREYPDIEDCLNRDLFQGGPKESNVCLLAEVGFSLSGRGFYYSGLLQAFLSEKDEGEIPHPSFLMNVAYLRPVRSAKEKK
jgi:hypothetical protein